MRRVILIGIGCLAVSVLCVCIVGSVVFDAVEAVMVEAKSQSSKYEAHIGEKCIIGTDTLIVVDYNIMKDQFTLSNGIVVAGEMVFNQHK